MTKETYQYLVNIRDFEGHDGSKGLTVTVPSEYELTESELSNKVMSMMVAEYDRLAHELKDEHASKKLMNLSGVKDLKHLESKVIAIEHEVRYDCLTDEF